MSSASKRERLDVGEDGVEGVEVEVAPNQASGKSSLPLFRVTNFPVSIFTIVTRRQSSCFDGPDPLVRRTWLLVASIFTTPARPRWLLRRRPGAYSLGRPPAQRIRPSMTVPD